MVLWYVYGKTVLLMNLVMILNIVLKNDIVTIMGNVSEVWMLLDVIVKTNIEALSAKLGDLTCRVLWCRLEIDLVLL
jgi:hypothetical protein